VLFAVRIVLLPEGGIRWKVMVGHRCSPETTGAPCIGRFVERDPLEVRDPMMECKARARKDTLSVDALVPTMHDPQSTGNADERRIRCVVRDLLKQVNGHPRSTWAVFELKNKKFSNHFVNKTV
jgi:hypothetical protein